MPALMTHDAFGRDVYGRLYRLIGQSRDEADLFLLGCQGPDALFFAAPNPRLRSAFGLGSALHRADPDQLLAAFRAAAARQPTAAARAIARAYVMGLACHYLLDSAVHPLIYAQQHALCAAGVEGLDERDGHEVHAAIETELDELVLWTRRGVTIAEVDPAREVLRGRPETLAVASALYAEVAAEVLGTQVPPDAFAACVRQWRSAMRLLRSPTGLKRQALGAAERLLRRHSMLQALSHRPCERERSAFANEGREPWEDPATGQVRTEGFWDLYEGALQAAMALLPALDAPGFSAEDARRFTEGRDFLGNLAVPVVVSVEPLAPAPS